MDVREISVHTLFAAIPLHVWKGVFLCARGYVPDGYIAKFPCPELRSFGSCVSQHTGLAAFARRSACMLKFYGYLCDELAVRFCAVISYAVQRQQLMRIMETDASTLPGIARPQSDAFRLQHLSESFLENLVVRRKGPECPPPRIRVLITTILYTINWLVLRYFLPTSHSSCLRWLKFRVGM